MAIVTDTWLSGVTPKLDPEKSGYVLLHVTPETFEEIGRKIVEAAGNRHAFGYDGRLINMFGCALVREVPENQ